MGHDVEGMAHDCRCFVLSRLPLMKASTALGMFTSTTIWARPKGGSHENDQAWVACHSGLCRRLCCSTKLGMQVNLAGKTAESSVSSAAVLQIAAAAPSIEWGVSPTTPFLKSDVVENPIRVIKGRADVPSGPGLGVEVNEDALAEFVR